MQFFCLKSKFNMCTNTFVIPLTINEPECFVMQKKTDEINRGQTVHA